MRQHVALISSQSSITLIYIGALMFSDELISLWVERCALGLYTANLGVGLVAQLRWVKLGVTHHILYFFVFLSVLGATFTNPNPLLCVTLAALAYMPRSRPGTWRHPAAALIGYLGLLLSRF